MTDVKSDNTLLSHRKIFIDVSCPSDSFQFQFRIHFEIHLRLSDTYYSLGFKFKLHQGNEGDNTTFTTGWGKTNKKSLPILK